MKYLNKSLIQFKMMRNSLLILVVFLFNCERQKQNATIRIEDHIESPSFKEYFSSMEIIPLETNSKFYINRANRVLFHHDKYYIFDRMLATIFIFNDEGKYVNKVYSKGRGPQEYATLNNFDVDKHNKTILLLDNLSKVLVYDLEGEFIEEFRLPKDKNFGFPNYIKAVSKDKLVLYSVIGEPKIAFYSRSENRYTKKFHQKGPTHKDGYRLVASQQGSPFISYYDERLNKEVMNFFESFTNDVYGINEKGLSPLYSWDFGKYNFDIDDFPKNKSRHEYMLYGRDKKKDWAYLFLKNKENSNYIFTQFFYRGEATMLVYDKTSQKHCLFRKFKEDFSISLYELSNEALINIVSAKSIDQYLGPSEFFKDEKNIEAINKVKETDNPILVKYNF